MSHSVLHPTLYTPATLAPEKLLALFRRGVEGVWRVVMCTEDSIREDEIPVAIDTLRTVLAGMDNSFGVTGYVRVRNPEVLARVLELPHTDKLRGFVIPKAEPGTFPAYAEQLAGSDFRVMPILESRHMVDYRFREELLETLRGYHRMIDCVRIGANDLLGYQGLRRDNQRFTIYDTCVRATIDAIINEFRGIGGFMVTAPVFECYASEYDSLLRREARQHIMNGLFGQTVIYPRHIRIIRDLYKVSPQDLESAQSILLDGASAVSGLHGRMDEITTHTRWAQTIVERHHLFGGSRSSRTLADVIK